jgi:chromosome partitioning protein
MQTCGEANMPTIAIISQKGGAGKTTLALHLAAAAEDAGHTALVIDLDPQATASQWAAWRKDAPPVVIDSAPPRLAAKIEQATGQGANFIVIDTPPHADSAASAAVEAADLVLIPCRPSAFDLAAVQTTASLVKMRGKPAFVIFTAGSPTAPRMYDEAAQVVQGYGLESCPHIIPDRAAFRHAAAEGKTAMEIEPNGKAAEEIRQLYKWACKHVNMQTYKKRRTAA